MILFFFASEDISGKISFMISDNTKYQFLYSPLNKGFFD